MATTSTQLDSSSTRDRVLEVIRGLLAELGSQGVLPMLSSVSLLDRDLGLGSLERVELLARLETEFGVRLPDRVAAEANTLRASSAASGAIATVYLDGERNGARSRLQGLRLELLPAHLVSQYRHAPGEGRPESEPVNGVVS